MVYPDHLEAAIAGTRRVKILFDEVELEDLGNALATGLVPRGQRAIGCF